MAENETVTWGEVCKKVSFGDGLYQRCRDKVTGFDGFQNGAFDEGGDFDEKLTKSALSVPEPPPGNLPRQREGLFGPVAEREPAPGFFSDISFEKLLLYGGLGAVLWFYLRKKPQPVAATEDAPVTTPVTDAKAA